VQQLPYSDGRYHFVLPTVVGPRFIPGGPTGYQGTGMLPDTDQVADASRITPPVLPENVAPRYRIDFQLDLEADMAIHALESASHVLDLEWQSDRRVTLRLSKDESEPNRDIEFTYSLDGDQPQVGLLTHMDAERGGFFTLMVQPPLDTDQVTVHPQGDGLRD